MLMTEIDKLRENNLDTEPETLNEILDSLKKTSPHLFKKKSCLKSCKNNILGCMPSPCCQLTDLDKKLQDLHFYKPGMKMDTFFETPSSAITDFETDASVGESIRKKGKKQLHSNFVFKVNGNGHGMIKQRHYPTNLELP